MKPDPILEELWRIKDKLAAEAGYDAGQFAQNLQEWEKEHLGTAGVIRSPEELRAYAAAEEERRRAENAGLALKEEPKKADPKS